MEDPRQYTVEMLVDPTSPMVGKTIEEAGLRHLPGSYLAEIDRDGMVLPAVAPEESLRANDRLVFVGVIESVVDLQRTRGLKPATDQVFKLDSPRSQRCLIEAVISNTCSLVGKTIRDAEVPIELQRRRPGRGPQRRTSARQDRRYRSDAPATRYCSKRIRRSSNNTATAATSFSSASCRTRIPPSTIRPASRSQFSSP
ncbi:MAG: TrkA C-terminal domain-containing protein [Pirellulales bacterium]